MARQQFDTLDGLRGIAALAVLVGHVPDRTFLHLLPTRHLAVDFFFVLSGFVLAHAYEQRLRGEMGPVEFMVRRYIRLWPLYLLGTFIGLVSLVGHMPPAPKLLAITSLAIFFVPVLSPRLTLYQQAVFPLNSPAWSLFFELLANVLYGLVARHLTNRRLAAILLVGLILLVGTWARFHELDAGSTIPHFWGGFGRVVWSYFAGVAIYRIWLARPSPRLPAWVLAAALVAMFATPWQLIWPLVGFPALVYLAASAQLDGRTKAAFTWLGTASYGIYVLQVPMVTVLSRWIDMASPWWTLAFAALVVVTAIVLDRVFDRPVRRWLEGRILPRARAAGAT